jgi:signal transduction histidine kinase
MTAAPAPASPSATANLTRVLCIAVAAAGVIFGALAVGPFLAQGWHPNPPLATAALLSAFGLPLTLGLCSRRGSPRLLRGIATLGAVCYVLVAGYWLIFGPGPLPPGAEIPWVISYTGVPAVALAVFASRRVAWSYTVLGAALSGAVRYRTATDDPPALVGLSDGLYSLLLVGVFVALTLAAREAAERVDATTLRTRQAEARRAARVARRQERLRIDALVHDSVISTLLMAGLGRTPLSVVTAHAAKTLRQLEAIRQPAVQPVVLVSDVVRRLRSLTEQIAPDATVLVHDPAARGTGTAVERTVPAVAVAAMLGAAGEALRNSVAAAAGPADAATSARRVRRTVTLLSTPDGCQITVSDDGVGFDPATVPPERLGIAQSILGRMDRVPGGAANLRSAPGRGTDVVIVWAPERLVEGTGIGPAARTAPPQPRSAAAQPTTATHPASADYVAPLVHPERRAIARQLVDAPAPAQTRSLAQSLGLSSTTTQSILAVFVLVHGLLAVIDLEPGRPLQLVVAAYLAIVAAAALLMTRFDGPVPRPRIALILGLCAVGAILMFTYLPPESDAPFAHWHLGAITLVLVVLSLRGHIGWAWFGYLGLACLAVGWARVTDQPPFTGVGLVSRHAGTLLAATLFVVGMHRTERALWVLTARDIAQATDDATTVAALGEREAELMRVNTLAQPTLRRLAEQRPLTDDERAQCLLIEAGLRDAIRGRALFVEPVISAVANARQRGVEVTMLDDSAETPPDALPALARTVADVLDTVDAGRVTVRVLPAGRPNVATLVIESGTHRILAIGLDGRPRPAT